MTPEVTFHIAEKADLSAIIGLLADDALGATREQPGEIIAPAYLEAFRVMRSNPDQLLVVGKQDGEVVATLQLTFIPGLSHRGAWRGQIEGVRVASGLRGRGIGESVIAWAIERCRERNCRMVQLTSNAQRTDARRFYERLGFAPSHVGFKKEL